MRSEKEIKEKDFDIFMEIYDDYYTRQLNQKYLKKWVLEGEPRYSVAELEKVISYCNKKYSDNDDKFFSKIREFARIDTWFENKFDILIPLLKDKKKVQEILK